jgi:hypothetical protein
VAAAIVALFVVGGGQVCVEATAKGLLTDGEFKEATWDWVQNTNTAATKWGDIGDWDTSGVGDFSYAFSYNRNEAGGSYVKNGNPKAATFVGTGISKWNTASATSLLSTFRGASEMNSDLGGWTVSKVTTLYRTFTSAYKFTGTGLSKWNTTSVTSMTNTFNLAREMNSDLSGWSVGKVTEMFYTFYGASKFVGTGLNLWDTASTVSMRYAFNAAREMNSDLSKWNVAKVKTLEFMFNSASKFVGTGLSEWDTTSVTNLNSIFYGAVSMNVNLGGWSVAKGE